MQEKDQAKEFLGVGWKFPPQVDPVTGRMQVSGYEDNVAESVRLILSTRKGERMMNPEFGCGLFQYLFGEAHYTTLVQMEREAQDALIRWEPRIRDITVQAQVDQGDPSRVNLYIQYWVRSTNNPFNLVYPFYLQEGND